jgi:hypothetical protein
METVNSGSAFATFFPFFLLMVPFIILNGIISRRKGKNRLKYILLSFIPLIGVYLVIYLVSFLDKDIQDKIDKIYEKMDAQKRLSPEFNACLVMRYACVY